MGSVGRVDFMNSVFKRFSLPGEFAFAIHEDKAERLWIGTGEHGLYKLDRETERSTPYLGKESNNSNLNQYRDSSAVTRTRSGALWIGTTG